MPRSITLTELFDFINKSVSDITDKESMQTIGNAVVEIIRTRTRLGYGVASTGGKRQRLKALSVVYKDFRKATRSNLSSVTRVNRSNLTYTGQLLDDISAVGAKDGSIRIEPTGVRPGGLKNIDLGEYVSEQGRPFLNVSDNELRQLTRIVDGGLNKSLRRRLGR